MSEEQTLLLRSVLSFYDRFAEQNATNPRLQGEAAWAHRKVGALYQRLGRDAEAEEATARAIRMLEELVRQYPADPDLRSKLVEASIIEDPATVAPASIGRVERQLLRSRELIGGLVAESPSNVEYLDDRVQVDARLGAALQRLGRLDEAEAAYADSIAHAGAYLEAAPGDIRPLLDRTAIREILAALRIDRGRREAARSELDAVAKDLRAATAREAPGRPIFDRLTTLAELYRALDDPAHADEATRWAQEIEAQSPPGGPPRDGPGGRPGPNP